MFDALRRMIIPIITIVLVFFVGMIVLEWGLGFSGRQQFDDANVAGAVNGEEISWQAYQQTYDNLYRQASASTDEDISDTRVRQLQDEAWNQLVTEMLLQQQVSKMQISVTDDEVYGYLRNSPPQEVRQLPYFQNEQGQFDYQRYLNAMADPEVAQFWNSLLPFVRQEILRLKVQEWVLQTAHVTEMEIKNEFVQQAESVKVAFVNVPFALYSSPPPRPSLDELRAFYEKNKEAYRIERQAAIRIAIIEKGPSELDREQSRSTIQAIYDSLMSGSDFADMAGTYSEDASGPNGGDLGWFNKGQMVQPFDSISFALDSGDVSEPFQTQFGWHIVKHYGYRDQSRKDPQTGKTVKDKQAHAAHILIKDAASRETLDEAYNKLSRLATQARGGDFVALAAENDIEIKEPAPFGKSGAIQFVGSDPAVRQFALQKNAGDISDVFENNSALYVCQIIQHKPEGYSEFEMVEDRARQDFVKEAVSATCADTAAAILAAIESGKSMKDAAKPYDATYKESKMIPRGGRFEGLPNDPVLAGAAFSLMQPNEMTGVVNHVQGAIIMKLLERTQPDLSAFNLKRDSIRTAVLTRKQQELYGRWFQNLRDNAQIVNNINRQREADLEGELL